MHGDASTVGDRLKLDLGQTLNTLANVGVIAGIIFLGLELRQNNAFLSADARYNLLLNRRPLHLLVMQDADFAGLLVKSRTDTELSEVETEQLFWYYDLLFASMDYDYQQYRDGLVDESALPIRDWIAALNSEDHGLLSFWGANKDSYSPEFVRFIDEEIIQ